MMSSKPIDTSAIVIEEIALEGLDGITLDSLWLRLSVRQLALDVKQEKVCNYFWRVIVCNYANSGELAFYELPNSRNTIQLYDRYKHINQETGTCVEDYNFVPENVYEIEPISDGNIRGSCKLYKERVEITKHVLDSQMTLNEVNRKYGNKFVVVAAQRLREEALRIPYVNFCLDLTPMQYCILERVGRSRYQGEVTIGKEAPNYKETPKSLFYFRKKLIRCGLIKKQTHVLHEPKTGQNRHGLLLMLPRFYSLRLTPIAVAAKKINDVLLTEPNNECDYTTLREKTGIKQKMFRHVFPSYLKNFKVHEYTDEEDEKAVTRRRVKLIKPINLQDDEESDGEADGDDDDEDVPCLKECNDLSKLGQIFNPCTILADRTMLTQALCVIESCQAKNGISLREIGEHLKLPKLEVRALTRILERLGEVTAIRVEEGRQKITHYIPRNKIDDAMKRFADERKSLNFNVKETITYYRRANLILETVKECKIVDQLFRFKKVIQQAEKDNPYAVDQHTVKRIVQKLAVDGHIRSIKTMLQCNNQVKKLHIVCDPSITADSPLIRDKIEQLKFRYFGTTEDESREVRKSARKSNPKFKSFDDDDSEEINLVYQPSIGRKYGLQPKMKKLLVFYKFLFYLLCSKVEPNDDYDDWRRYVQSLPEGCFSEEETCTLGDIIPRLPLSIFVKIVFITYIIPGLEDYLNDPIRKNHTLSMLPSSLRRKLMYKRKFIFNLVELLTSLSYMDLVKITYKEQHPKESLIVKILRKPKLKDRGTLKEYNLQTLDDVDIFTLDLTVHCSKPDCPDCSLDARLFAHNQRNWTYTPKIRNAFQSKLDNWPKLKSKENFNFLRSNPSTSIFDIESNQSAQKRKRSRKRKNKASHKSRKKARTADSTDSNSRDDIIVRKSKKSETRRQEEELPLQKLSSRAPSYDHIDLAALKLMKKSRCEWTKEEDSFLLMCRVASVLLDPLCPTYICVNRVVVRDELHKHFPEVSKDKTAKSCQRRLMYMLKKAKTRQNVIDWVIECKQDIEFMNIKRPEVPKTRRDVWQEAFLRLLYALLNKFQAHHLSYTSNIVYETMEFNSIEELTRNFKVVASEYVLPYKPILHQEPHNVVDIYVSVVMNVLISTLMVNFQKENASLFAHTLFKIYQRYPDTLIRSVVTKLQKNGVMSKIKNKCDVSTLRSRGATPFKISQHYIFTLKTRLCMDTLPRALDSTFAIADYVDATDAAIVTSLLTSRNARFEINLPENIISFDENKLSPKQSESLKGECSKMPKILWSSRLALHAFRQHLSLDVKDGRSMQDNLVLSKCHVTCKLRHPIDPDFDSLNYLLDKQMKFIDNVTAHDDSVGSELSQFIKSKKELGTTKEQIIEFSQGFWPEAEMMELLENDFVYRVGVTVFRYVHHDYINPWLVHSILYRYPSSSRPTSDSRPVKFIARCWKNPNGSLDTRVLFKYISAIFGHIYINPGIAECELISNFHICLPPIQVIEILELLVASKCVIITEMDIISKFTLFESNELPKKHMRYYEATADAFTIICRLKSILSPEKKKKQDNINKLMILLNMRKKFVLLYTEL
ncbi:general transcription factor 3C polypeptide 1-like protein [Dinothrombium tinctorium]|uniref:General transcription factor 3C polypeptide 1-like protein n=1 Tax=Dinothrombium tinctorium TaxID=1965070 RepID=A0A3S3NVT1_9ACAR|nr:general transcription factor 3C polypeptide 1-like protein [Dinothrombium tinctorium]